ncbi:hypothetical protein L596_000172 [Steinernema carpocapsae]|uniref:PDZ domain-containing protein n=1 Tax=Steinernema carpocapsae TaxID=34508 RepID=A0A4U8UHG7_STECR|nr:hypothetical protein L596_000172 [Steinernema carpocapsae]
MAYETINVRMNRSNQSIHWGFTLRQGSGNEIVIANVERDSMAEKAGLCTNDIITDIMGAQGLNLSQANQKVNAAFEISMNLKRWVTNMPTLPWTLNEKDNKIVVSSVGNGGMRPLHTQNSDGFINSFSSTTQSGRGPSQSRELSSSNYQRNFQETRTQSSTSPGGIQLSQTSPRATFQPQISLTSGALNPKSNTMSTHSHSSWDTQDGNVKKHFESSKSYEKTESSSTTEFDRPIGAQGAFTHSGTAGFGSGINGFGSGAGAGSGGFISGGGAGGLGSDVNGFGSGAGGRVNTGSSFGKTGWGSSGFRDDTFRHNGINQQLNTQIPSQTGGGRAVSMQHSPAAFSPRAAQPQRPLTASPYTGPRQYYQHNPRTVRELSPTASVQHLQYNSPMNLYSSENAAEAYRQQTGGLFGTDPNINQSNEPPAYLSSETRRLIAENESGYPRSCSPCTQSASFKRISNACGTPVN